MNDSFEARRKAAEESYFIKQEEEALKRLQAKQSKDTPRLSPITGKPMVQESIGGVIVDRCVDSKGIFLDAGELEELLKAATSEASSSWIGSFFGKLKG